MAEVYSINKAGGPFAIKAYRLIYKQGYKVASELLETKV